MGLLDGNIDPAANNGLLSLGLALMANRSRPGAGGFLDAIGQAGPVGMQGMTAFQDRQFQQKLREEQMAEIARKKVLQGREDEKYKQELEKYTLEKVFRDSIPSPQMQGVQGALLGGGGPTIANAANIPPADPMANLSHGAMRAGVMAPLDYLKLQQKDESPLIAKEGDVLLNRKNYKPLFSNPKDDRTGDQKDYQAAVMQGYTGNLIDYQREMANLKAPKTNVTVPVNVSAEKKYGEQFAGKMAEADSSLRDSATRAPDLADRALRVKKILGDGKAITGIGADFRLQFAKAAALAGIKGAGDSAADTETLAASLSQNTLDAIKASGLGAGSGFSNADRDFLEKAAGGKITMEKTALLRLANLAHQAAQQSANKWNTRVKQIPKSALEGTGIDTTPVGVPSNVPDASGWSIKPM